VNHAANFGEVDTAGAGAVPLTEVVNYLKPRVDREALKLIVGVVSTMPEIKSKKTAITAAEFELVMRLVALQQSKGSIPAGTTAAALRGMDLPTAQLKGSGSGSGGAPAAPPAAPAAPAAGPGPAVPAAAAAVAAGVNHTANFSEVDTKGAGSVPLTDVVNYLKPRVDREALKLIVGVVSTMPEIKSKKTAITPAEFELVMRLVALQQSKGSIPPGTTAAALRGMDLPVAQLKGSGGDGASAAASAPAVVVAAAASAPAAPAAAAAAASAGVNHAANFGEVDTTGAGAVPLTDVVNYLKPRVDREALKLIVGVVSTMPEIKSKKTAITAAEFELVMRLVALQQSKGSIPPGTTAAALRAMALPAAELKGGNGGGGGGGGGGGAPTAPPAPAAPAAAAVNHAANFGEVDTAGAGAVPLTDVVNYLKSRVDREALKLVVGAVSTMPEIKSKKTAVSAAEFELVMRLVALQQSKGSIPAGVTAAALRSMSLPAAQLKGSDAGAPAAPPPASAGGGGGGSSGGSSGSSSGTGSSSGSSSPDYSRFFKEVDKAGAGSVELTEVVNYLKPRVEREALKQVVGAVSTMAEIKSKKKAITPAEFDLVMRLVAMQQAHGAIQAGVTAASLRGMNLPPVQLAGAGAAPSGPGVDAGAAGTAAGGGGVVDHSAKFKEVDKAGAGAVSLPEVVSYLKPMVDRDVLKDVLGAVSKMPEVMAKKKAVTAVEFALVMRLVALRQSKGSIPDGVTAAQLLAMQLPAVQLK
jgi:hypothetical protein